MAKEELGKKIACYDTVELGQKGKEEENWITILHGFPNTCMILHQKRRGENSVDGVKHK